MPVENFYAYENWTNTCTKAHRGSCTYCRDGQGFQGRGNRTPSGQWLGPFSSLSEGMNEATRAARRHDNYEVWSIGVCGHCG